MWINLSRQQRPAAGAVPTAAAGTGAPHLLPPPGPPAPPGLFLLHPTAAALAPAPLAPAAVTATAVHYLRPSSSHITTAAAAAAAAAVGNLVGTGGGREAAPAAKESLPPTPASKFKRLKIFIKSTKKDRRKKDERKRRSETGGGGESLRSPGELPFTAGCCGLQEDPARPPPYQGPRPSSPDPFCDGRPTAAAEGAGTNPFRRSYRLAGHASDLGSGRNMLPLWLEEHDGQERQATTTCLPWGEASVLDVDTSFETRWDSLRNKNKVRSSCHLEKRPAGWEDIGHNGGGGKEKNANMDKAKFCPSFVIKEAPQTGQHPADSHRFSPLAIESPASPRVRRRNHEIVREMNEANIFDFKEFSENVNHLFPESRLQVRGNSISTSNVAPQSASNSPSKTGGDTSPSITDPRLWASSDSFICEDFTFYDRKRRDDQNGEFLPPPRSYSQVLLLGGRPGEYPGHQDTAHHHSHQLPDNFTHDDGFGGLDPQLTLAISNDSLEIGCNREGSDMSPDDRAAREDVFYASTNPPTTTTSRVTDDDDFHTIHGDCEASAASLYMTNNVQRGDWIKFDGGSTEHLDVSSEELSDFSSTDNFSTENVNDVRVARDSVTSTTSPPSTGDHHNSILNLVDPSVTPASATYRGRLIRTYSQRGRRVSKNVLNSVSRRINATDYGKLADPVPPRYSRAALTMQGGPGLFEEAPPRADNTRASENTERSLEGKNGDARAMEAPLRKAIISPSDIVASTYLEPALPQRVGSMRVPRLTSTLVRRSVSLNIPKVEKEVPFQRLPDRRPGSFRKAMSGLGALARSFKRKSVSEPVRATASKPGQNGAAPPGAGVRRTGTFVVAPSKQTPRAPRLPRRAISHRIVTPTHQTPESSSPQL